MPPSNEAVSLDPENLFRDFACREKRSRYSVRDLQPKTEELSISSLCAILRQP